MDCSLLGSSVQGIPGKNTRVSCHFLLQGFFLTQGSNPGLLHCRQILYHLSHQGIPEQTLWLVKTNLGTTALESKIQWDWGRELKNLHFWQVPTWCWSWSVIKDSMAIWGFSFQNRENILFHKGFTNFLWQLLLLLNEWLLSVPSRAIVMLWDSHSSIPQ